MKYTTRAYPLFSACGLNCGLCPNFHLHTNGQFKCPGCAGEGFSKAHPSCGILTCCQRKGLEFCCDCNEFPCKRYDGAGLTDSFITHKNQFKDFGKFKETGIDAYKAEQDYKIKVLEHLLMNYNDGRRKSLFCTTVNLLELQDIKIVMERIAAETPQKATLKEKAAIAAKLFSEMALSPDISLKLRR